jgi:hypothetical protein
METMIVAWDPRGEVRRGTEMSEPLAARKLTDEGAVLLPANPPIPPSACGGFVANDWGRGWEFDRNAGERGCPMLLEVRPELSWVYWAALVEPIREGEPIVGKLRLTTDSSVGRAMSGGMSSDGRPFVELGRAEVVGGRTHFSSNERGLLAICLYATAMNARVVWSAASQSSLRIDLPHFRSIDGVREA